MIRSPLLALALLAPAGCQQAATQYDAAEDVRAFITAVRENDRAAFERHLDRPALRAQLLPQAKAAIAAQAGPLGAVLSERLDESVVDGVIQPESFRLMLERSGAPARTPTAAEIATQRRVEGGGRVCLPRAPGGPCAITFAQSGTGEAAVWKLVAIDATGVNISDLAK